MNFITFELCAEDRARLDRLIAALEANAPNSNPQTCSAKCAPVSNEPEQIKLEVERPIEQSVEHDSEPETVAPVVTEEDIRSVARALIEKGKKPQLKEIINKYAPSITDIPTEAMPAVYEQLKAIVEAGK